ncbi:MAG TPA: DUF11 domain-containing protein [Tahibacter sp.]|nr:DUF11 domain-containing protein [Tahibacter sp.]
MKRTHVLLCAVLFCGSAGAVEQTLQNDSITSSSNAAIVYGFVAGEAAASWLTSPCTGDIRAVQIFWRSPNADQPTSIQDTIEVRRAGTFPNPGTLVTTIGGPVLTDGVFNEYRYLDENNTIPLIVPVTQGETIVVSFTFAEPPDPGTASLLRDTNGNQTGKNALLADIGGTFVWFNSSTLGVQGDWAIRAVVDCPTAPTTADLAVTVESDSAGYIAGQALSYLVTVTNNGPSAASASVVDIFPAAYTAPSWACVASGGASCASTGSGNITQSVNLPVGSSVAYAVTGTVAAATTGTLANSATALVGSPTTDPQSGNNTATLNLEPDTDRIFDDGFDP